MLLCSCFALSAANSQTQYPSRAIKFVVQAVPGGVPDTVARIIGRRLQERLGYPVVVENRPGANGSIAATALTSSPADGYTFMVTDGSVVSINPVLYHELPYDPHDLLPVALVARTPLYLAVNTKVPIDTMQGFIEYVRAHPGQLNYGSSGVGSTHHLTMEAIKADLHLNIVHVPYKGVGESVPALLGGQIDFVWSAYSSLKGLAEDKRVKLIAQNSAERSSIVPDVPPVADFIPGFDFAPLIGIFARAGTPPALIQKIAAEVDAIANEPETIRQFVNVGIEPVGAGPDALEQALKSEIERVAKVVEAAGIRPQ
jgi:tripartite-type tricarboxylate transporter receptor subunit TctC